MKDQDEMFEAATETPSFLGCPSLGPKTLPSGFDGTEAGEEDDAEISKMYSLAYDRVADNLKSEAAYIAGRVAALNRRAILYKGAPCAIRARAEITGMLTVLSALGWEVDCTWDQYDSDVTIVPVALIASVAENGGQA